MPDVITKLDAWRLGDPALKMHQNFTQLQGQQPQVQMVVPSTITAQAATVAIQKWGPNDPNAIYFYESNKPYYEFTNFYMRPITIDGEVWPSVEHYFQAQKFAGNPGMQEMVRAAKSPRDAFNITRDPKFDQFKVDRNEWENNLRYQVMVKGIREKFTQLPDLKEKLLATGNKILVEDAGLNDRIWGAGPDYTGSNQLGRILMHVRDELRPDPAGKIPVRTPYNPFIPFGQQPSPEVGQLGKKVPPLPQRPAQHILRTQSPQMPEQNLRGQTANRNLLPPPSSTAIPLPSQILSQQDQRVFQPPLDVAKNVQIGLQFNNATEYQPLVITIRDQFDNILLSEALANNQWTNNLNLAGAAWPITVEVHAQNGINGSIQITPERLLYELLPRGGTFIPQNFVGTILVGIYVYRDRFDVKGILQPVR